MSRWTAGESGNPNGRPKGSGRVQKLRERLGKHLPELLDRLMLQALMGDTTATKLILDKVMPNLRPEALPIYLPALNVDSSFVQQGKQVMAAIAEGRIPPDVGQQFMTGLATLAGLKTVTELEDLVRQLNGEQDHGDLA